MEHLLSAIPPLKEDSAPPLFSDPVTAGFPSPAEDLIEAKLDLNQFLVKNPPATFFLRVQGNSMEGAKIYSGDILIVDRSLAPAHNKIIVASVQGSFTVKRLHIEGKKISLHAEHPDYPPIPITSDSDFELFGVVTFVIHKAI